MRKGGREGEEEVGVIKNERRRSAGEKKLKKEGEWKRSKERVGEKRKGGIERRTRLVLKSRKGRSE